MSDKQAYLLIIEDSHDYRAILKDLLQTHYPVLEADSASAAEPLLEKHEVGVILCDQQMPGENGLDFFARIRWQYPQAQRLLLTGHSDQASLLKAINRSHVMRYLEKPAKNDTILDAVKLGFRLYEEFIDARRIHREHEEMRTTMKSLPYLAKRMKDISIHAWDLFRRALVVISGSALLSLLLGILVLVILYIIKTKLDINIFQDVHFHDIFK